MSVGACIAQFVLQLNMVLKWLHSALSVVFEYCLANATTVKIQRHHFLYVQGENNLFCQKLTCVTGGIRSERDAPCWRYQVRQCVFLEISG
jgi:hypothetical protein